MTKHTATLLVTAILALLFVEVAAAQPAPDPKRLEAGKALAAVYRDGGYEALCEHLSEAMKSEPILMVGACGDVARFFYWKRKDVTSAADVLRAGLFMGEVRADYLRRKGPEVANKLLAAVKGLAYDLGSFTWPGWNEPGLAISKEAVRAGRDAARTNLELAFKLKKDAGPMSAAHWLLGAHCLAAQDTRGALPEFLKAKEKAVEAGKPVEAFMTDGYIGITLVVRGDLDGKGHLREAIKSLEKDGSDDAKFYASQLRTAFKVFAGAAAGVGGWRSREFKGDGFTVSVHLSRTANLFHALDRLPVSGAEDAEQLARYTALRQAKEGSDALAKTLLTSKNLDDALFAGVAAEHITQEQMMELGGILRHFAPRVDESGDRHREALVVSLESLDEAKITEVAERSAKSCGAEQFSFDCYLTPGGDKCAVYDMSGSRVGIEVVPGEDVTHLLLDVIARACLDLAKREEEEDGGK